MTALLIAWLIIGVMFVIGYATESSGIRLDRILTNVYGFLLSVTIITLLWPIVIYNELYANE